MAAGDIIIPNNTITPEILQKISAEVEKLISSNAKDPGEWEEVGSLQGITSLPVLQQMGTAYKLVRVAVSILQGVNGREVELQLNQEKTKLEWRYVGVSGSNIEPTEWRTLVDLSLLKGEAGDTPEFRKGASGLEWKYQSEDTGAWRTLVPLSDIIFTFGDLTPEQIQSIWQNIPESAITLFQRPATEAAAEARTAISEATEATAKATEATTQAATATDAANTAAGHANRAAETANQAAGQVGTAIETVTEVTSQATEATKNAITATTAANEAAGKANTATQNATEATTKATEATTHATEATTAASSATEAANRATSAATTAAGRVNTAIESATEATTAARQATKAANTATATANQAAETANTAAGTAAAATANATEATNKATEATGKATAATTRAEQAIQNAATATAAANTAADRANRAAETAEGVISGLQPDWNVTDPVNKNYIKNKPEIPTLEAAPTAETLSYVNTDGTTINYRIGDEVRVAEEGEYVFYRLYDLAGGKASWQEAGSGTALPGNVYLTGADYYNESVRTIKQGYLSNE